jgi:hypothetical protein
MMSKSLIAAALFVTAAANPTYAPAYAPRPTNPPDIESLVSSLPSCLEKCKTSLTADSTEASMTAECVYSLLDICELDSAKQLPACTKCANRGFDTACFDAWKAAAVDADFRCPALDSDITDNSCTKSAPIGLGALAMFGALFN